jgi:hypothetical protein
LGEEGIHVKRMDAKTAPPELDEVSKGFNLWTRN